MSLLMIGCGVWVFLYAVCYTIKNNQRKKSLEKYAFLVVKLYFSNPGEDNPGFSMRSVHYGSLLFEAEKIHADIEKIKIKNIRFIKTPFRTLHFRSLILPLHLQKKEVMRSVSTSYPKNCTLPTSPISVWLSGKVYLRDGTQKTFAYNTVAEVLNLNTQKDTYYI